jgi:hypothetical protein
MLIPPGSGPGPKRIRQLYRSGNLCCPGNHKQAQRKSGRTLRWRVFARVIAFFPFKRRPPKDGGDTEGAAARAIAERMPLLVCAELTGLHVEWG